MALLESFRGLEALRLKMKTFSETAFSLRKTLFSSEIEAKFVFSENLKVPSALCLVNPVAVESF